VGNRCTSKNSEYKYTHVSEGMKEVRSPGYSRRIRCEVAVFRLDLPFSIDDLAGAGPMKGNRIAGGKGGGDAIVRIPQKWMARASS